MENGNRYPATFDGLMSLVQRLRGPDGCPWDREQTRESMKRYLLEELYELLQAMDEGDEKGMTEELGDLMFHLAFQVQLGKEESAHDETDVFRSVIGKLVQRHPHVFGGAKASDAQEVEANWNALKRQGGSGAEDSIIGGVAKVLPALSYAHTIQERAARSGFDWEDIHGVLGDVREELDELEEADSKKEMHDELGDVLFSFVNLGRWLKIDAEGALRASNDRFRKRFQRMERLSSERGVPFEGLTLDEKDALWEEAKRSEG